MQKTIDINADLGEHAYLDVSNLDEQLMPLISSCNIACGGHAGDEKSMLKSIQLALANEVSIGAHPSYPDRKNFGRLKMKISNAVLAENLIQQITELQNIAYQQNATIHHVKPHGALYNLAADDDSMALLICETIAKINPNFALLGLAESAMKEAAYKTGIEFWSEAFIDRRYDKNRRLVSRNKPGAVLNLTEGLQQLKTLMQKGKIITNDGTKIPLKAMSCCVHSDTPEAVEMAHAIVKYLNQAAIEIRPIK